MASLNFLRRLLVLLIAASLVAGCYASQPTDISPTALRQLAKRPAETIVAKQLVAVGQELTIASAVQYALTHDATIAARRAEVTATSAGVQAAGALPNPELRVSQVQLDPDLLADDELDIDLRARLPRLGELTARQALAQADLREAKANLWAAEWQVEMEVRRLLFDLFIIGQEIKTMAQLVRVQHELVLSLQRVVTDGLVTETELAMQELAWHETSADLLTLQGSQQTAVNALSQRSGLSADELVKADGILSTIWPAFTDLPDEETATNTALQHRAEIEQAAAALDRSLIQMALAKMARWPWFSYLQVGWDQHDDETRAWEASLGVELPIFSMGGVDLRHAEARHIQAKRELAATVDEIDQEVSAKWHRLAAVAKALAYMEGETLPAVKRAMQALEKAWHARQVNASDRARIRVRQAKVERRIIRLRQQYGEAYLDLLEAAGRSNW